MPSDARYKIHPRSSPINTGASSSAPTATKCGAELGREEAKRQVFIANHRQRQFNFYRRFIVNSYNNNNTTTNNNYNKLISWSNNNSSALRNKSRYSAKTALFRYRTCCNGSVILQRPTSAVNHSSLYRHQQHITGATATTRQLPSPSARNTTDPIPPLVSGSLQ